MRYTYHANPRILSSSDQTYTSPYDSRAIDPTHYAREYRQFMIGSRNRLSRGSAIIKHCWSYYSRASLVGQAHSALYGIEITGIKSKTYHNVVYNTSLDTPPLLSIIATASCREKDIEI